MKRSEINNIMREAIKFFDEMNFKLPPFAYFTPDEWKEKGEWGDDVDLVHWNAGLWDCIRQFGEEPNMPIEFYKYFIDRISVRIKNAVYLCSEIKTKALNNKKINTY